MKKQLILLLIIIVFSAISAKTDDDPEIILAASKPEDKPRQSDKLFGIKYKDILVPETVFIKAGNFNRGQPNPNLGCRDCARSEQPVVKIHISSFEIGRFEVTNAQYELFAKATNRETAEWRQYYKEKRENHPVVNVSWQDAQAYCAWLQANTGREYRLPTEAEWEYAARGGHTGNYPTGNELDHKDANFGGGQSTVEVNKFKPNRFGLYNVIGNVWEWCSDWYSETYYSESPTQDPQGPSQGQYRVIRGGGWEAKEDHCRLAKRFWHNPGFLLNGRGFRVAATIKPTKSNDANKTLSDSNN